jgi:membrane protein DedA with SNARE-associated domain
MVQFISTHGVWLVAAFIALESVGVPLPAEAALIAAGFFAARTHEINIWELVVAGCFAAMLGEVAGYWIGRRLGQPLLARHGARLGLTDRRLRISRGLFVRYGTRFVFIARFLPFFRNIAAVLAGTHAMPPRAFYLASCSAAVVWTMCYGLAAYWFGEAFAHMASPVAASLGLLAIFIVVVIPMLFSRYEERLLATVER